METRFKLRECCNPFSKQRHSSKRENLRNVTQRMVQRLPNLQLGWKICPKCRVEVYKLPVPSTSQQFDVLEDVESNVESQDVEFFDKDTALNSLQECLRFLGEPEIERRRINDEAYAERKLKDIMHSISTKIFNIPTVHESEHNDSFLERFVDKLRERYLKTDDKNLQFMILTLLPEDWPAAKIMKDFPGTTNYMVKKSKQIVREQGILCTRLRKSIDSGTEVSELVRNFYLNDDISRVMPGKKDFVSLKVDMKIMYSKS